MDDKTRFYTLGETDSTLGHEDLCLSIYRLSKQWRSTIEFIEDELNLFRFLLDKHLAVLLNAGNVEYTRSMVTNVSYLSNDRSELLRRIENHCQQIRALMQYPVSTNGQQFKDDHQKLESDVAGFMERFRSVKAEVFSAAERIIRAERARKVIDWG